MAARLLQRGVCGWRPALLLGARAESSAAAAVAAAAPPEAAVVRDAADDAMPQSVSDPTQRRRLERVLRMPVTPSLGPEGSSESEKKRLLELLRLHNSTYNLHGQIITAKVLDMDRKKILIDTGIKIAKIAHSDIRPECIVGTTRQDDAPRKPGEVRVGDVVQVFLESVETPEGDMLVSGQQAAQERRFRALWKELEDAQQARRPVKGRILNQLVGGYAVGVGGLVCFLPAQACHAITASRIGKLQDFWVTSMNKARSNVVLRDAQMSKLMAVQPRSGGAPRRGPAGRAMEGGGSKPRGAENPEQISAMAQELRELLAGKGRRPAGGEGDGGAASSGGSS